MGRDWTGIPGSCCFLKSFIRSFHKDFRGPPFIRLMGGDSFPIRHGPAVYDRSLTCTVFFHIMDLELLFL